MKICGSALPTFGATHVGAPITKHFLDAGECAVGCTLTLSRTNVVHEETLFGQQLILLCEPSCSVGEVRKQKEGNNGDGDCGDSFDLRPSERNHRRVAHNKEPLPTSVSLISIDAFGNSTGQDST